MESAKKFAALRIVFGAVWAINASFKWQPDFLNKFGDYLASGEGQPFFIQKWLQFWASLVNINPHLFALAVALIETVLALGLLLGLFTRAVSYAGIVFSLAIWSTAEGFGGPYTGGSTDIGSAVIYTLVFMALLFGESWRTWSLDALMPRFKS